jgi:carbamoyl-phosphate synthase small subunit
MTGYQEVLTDPSYCGQIVVMTAPEMGNTGVNLEDDEAVRPFVAGFVVHHLSPTVSNWRASLTRHIRDHGAQMAAIGTDDPATLHDHAKAAPPMTGQDLTTLVSTPSQYTWEEGAGNWAELRKHPARWHVVAIDFGIKRNILRCLVDSGCRVTVVPSSASASEILAHDPDGVFLSNGPGDPAAVQHGVSTIRDLLGKRPMFGICLGHQLLCLALGGSSYKLKFGHRGLNQPVQDLKTGRVEITTQNHGFAVDVESLQGKCETTHVHLNDGVCEGIRHPETGAFSVQYHPEASAGPHDARYLFERFVTTMGRERG